MDWLMNVAVIVGPRIAGALAAVIAGKLTEKGWTIDQATVLGVELAIYAGVHKALSAHVNPGDAAKGRVADAEKEAAATGTVVRVAPKT